MGDTPPEGEPYAELHPADRSIAESILRAFLDPKLAGRERSLTTPAVMQNLAKHVADHRADVFKAMLKEMCELSKPASPGQPGKWTLRREFWPLREAKPEPHPR